MKESVNILVTLDENYLFALNVMLSSLIHSNPNCTFSVYLLHSSLEEKMMEKTKEVLGSANQLIMIKVQDDRMKSAPTTARYPQEMYYRIFAAKYLPESVERILYLDPDIIVNGSILPLYHLPLEHHYFAAASHSGPLLTKFNSVRLDMEEDSPYINSGVMLMNIQLLRKEQDVEAVYQYIEKKRNLLFLPDQDIISSLYGSKVYELNPSIYNMTERLYQKRLLTEREFDVKWVRKHAVILHYLGKNKPWKTHYAGELNVFYEEALSRFLHQHP